MQLSEDLFFESTLALSAVFIRACTSTELTYHHIIYSTQQTR